MGENLYQSYLLCIVEIIIFTTSSKHGQNIIFLPLRADGEIGENLSPQKIWQLSCRMA